MCQVWLKFALVVVLEKRIFISFFMKFHFVTIISPWMVVWLFITFEFTWIPCTKECYVTSLFEIGSVNLKNFKVDHALSSPHGKRVWTSTWTHLIPFTHFCQVWLQSAQWFWKRICFIIHSLTRVMHKFTILLLSNLGKGRNPSF